MNILEIIEESTTRKFDPRRAGDALRVWTSNAMYRRSPHERKKGVDAAMYLSSIPNQTIPNFVYRAYGVDTDRTKDWKTLISNMHSKYPESYSATLRGLKSFLSGSGVERRALILAVRLNPNDFMFNLKSVAKLLPPSQLSIRDNAGFSIKEYFPQEEIVAKPGTLKKALESNDAYLIGYEKNNQFTYFSRPKKVNASINFPLQEQLFLL